MRQHLDGSTYRTWSGVLVAAFMVFSSTAEDAWARGGGFRGGSVRYSGSMGGSAPSGRMSSSGGGSRSYTTQGGTTIHAGGGYAEGPRGGEVAGGGVVIEGANGGTWARGGTAAKGPGGGIYARGGTVAVGPGGGAYARGGSAVVGPGGNYAVRGGAAVVGPGGNAAVRGYRYTGGARYSQLPAGFRRLYVGALPYYYWANTWYAPVEDESGAYYEAVEPPAEQFVEELPEGATLVTIDGVDYYTVNGVYYLPAVADGRTVYLVVTPGR